MGLLDLAQRVSGTQIAQTSQVQQTPAQPAPTATTHRQHRNRQAAPQVAKPQVAEPQAEMPPKKSTPTNAPKVNTNANFYVDGLARELRKLELWFGNPGSGKTTMAIALAEKLKEQNKIKDFLIINCHEEMTLQNILKTAKTDDDGKWKFPLNRTFQCMTDQAQENYIIIIDEANLWMPATMKGFQPYLDDTKRSFDFEEITYNKNPNVRFIMTMNHKDIGVSQLPDAIVDRAFPVFFEDLDVKKLSQWTNVPETFIDLLKRIHAMFAHLTPDLTPFYKSVRQLKMLAGLSKETFRHYIISHLELKQVEWEAVIKISPEFDNLINEYEKIVWR